MGVGRGGVDEDRIEGQQSRVEEPRNVRKEGRDVLRAAFGDRGARVASDEQRSMAEVGCHLRGEMRAGPLAVEVDDAHVAELLRARDERVEENRRRCRGTLEVDLLAGRDADDGVGRGDDAHLSRIGQRLQVAPCRVDRGFPSSGSAGVSTERRRNVRERPEYGQRTRPVDCEATKRAAVGPKSIGWCPPGRFRRLRGIETCRMALQVVFDCPVSRNRRL